jgi:Ca2+-binding RTX toxin-like protein
LNGGFGIDEADYSAAAGAVTVDLQDDPDGIGFFTGRAAVDGDGGVDRLVSIEWLRGGAGGDTLAGNSAQNRLRGEGGDDILIGRGGIDQLEGGAGADTFAFEATTDVTTIGSDRVRGPNEMGDILFGFESGIDTLRFDGAAFGEFSAGASLAEGTDFATIDAVYDGTNSGLAGAGFIYSTVDHTLSFDDGTGAGYQLVTTSVDGAFAQGGGDAITAGDISFA